MAPGKVVLLGEYAVLDGAPALVAAVDSGVACVYEPGEEWVIDAPDARFVGPALHAAAAPPGTWRFLPHNPLPTETKAGIGTSAAATVVAVHAALDLLRGEAPSPEEVRRLAHEVHRSVQGSGSGVDVAASAYGGVLRFEAGRCTPMPPVRPLVVWSGRSASTGPRVARYLAWSDRGAFAGASRQIVDEFPRAPIAALREAAALLDRMQAAAGLDYWTDGLRRIVDIAEDCGGGAKPSGAGGGDCAVALLPDPEREARFRQRCAAEGLAVLDLRVAGGCARIGSG